MLLAKLEKKTTAIVFKTAVFIMLSGDKEVALNFC
jgi:hypothetical protein